VSSRAHAARKWYPLDNAANVYPAVQSSKRPNVFRVSATLKEPVVPELLQTALDITLRRIPSFSVRLRSGLFWHYLSHSDDPLLIQEDVVNPCMRISHKRDKGFQIRVRYHDTRIALEVFHSVTDGGGAMTFLKTLVAQYLTQLGHDIPASHGVLDCSESPRPDEANDDFSAFAGDSSRAPREQGRAYHVSGTPLPRHDYEIITGTVPVDVIRAVARRYGASITEYLAGVFLHILAGIQQAEKRRRLRPVYVQVPVNLRRFHPSETLRNFSSYVCPGIDLTQGNRTFEETLASVHHFMRYEVTAQKLRSRVATNVHSESHPLLRPVPLFLKNQAIATVYNLSGPLAYSSVLTNLGVVRVPPAMHQHVEMFDFNLGPSHGTKINCTVLGYDGKLRVSFGRVIRETMVERAFFTFLVRHMIPVKVETNQEPAECPTA